MSEQNGEPTLRERVRRYVQEKCDLSLEERESRYRELVAFATGLDESTLALRRCCEEFGVPIVFPYPDNMPPGELARLLQASETQGNMNDPSLW